MAFYVVIESLPIVLQKTTKVHPPIFRAARPRQPGRGGWKLVFAVPTELTAKGDTGKYTNNNKEGKGKKL